MLTLDSEAPGAVGEGHLPIYKQGHAQMWMGQSQQVRGFWSGYMAAPVTALDSLLPAICSQRPHFYPSIP